MTSSIRIMRQNQSLLHKLLILLLFVSFLSVLISCSSTSKGYRDKVATFESRFPPGTLRSEVEEELLTESQPLEILTVSQMEDGDVIIGYRVDKSKWGAPTFYFRFSSDNELIVVWPILPEH